MDLIEKNSGPRHPWEKSRAAFFRSIFDRALHERGSRDSYDPVSVLDCGAGDAYFAAHLLAGFGGRVRGVTCWDANYRDETITELGHQYPRLSFTREMPKKVFGAAIMLDVIEHVEDDIGFVRNVVENCLEPGGLLLVSVPAWQSLFSRHDTRLLHHRRYKPKICDRVIEAAGIHIDKRGGLFHSLLVPRAIAVLGEHAASLVHRPLPPLESSSTAWSNAAAVTTVVDGAFRIDNALSRAASRVGLVVPGLSYWVIGHKQR
ncbi:MAG: class I SAM-dependent methyltransferase [Polyangiaceae bacterium]|nr:class I SAM-dependent methyltransferase [Polyangiaceae bacterium]